MSKLKEIKDNLEIYKAEIQKRGLQLDVEKIIADNEKRIELQTEIETLRAEQNKSSKKDISADEISKLKELKEQIKEKQAKLDEWQKKANNLAAKIPNITKDDVPVGKDEKDNVVVKEWGKKKDFKFPAQDHVALGKILDGLDMVKAAEVSGSRFYYLKNDLARLEMALINHAIDFVNKKSFEFVMPPILVREDAMYGTGFFPAEKNEIYNVNPADDNLFLIGTSEVSLASLHKNDILDKNELPKKYAAFSPCFRREAGSYGKDTKGIYRVHQFNKVEMFMYVDPEKSWDTHEELIKLSEEFIESLEIPYRTVNCCSGELSMTSAKRYDIEAWMPGRGSYGEVGSTSNTTDYQTKRLGIKTTNEKGEKVYCHTMNSTVMAAPRYIIAILENNQQADGSVVIPKVLQKYMNLKKLESQK
ncbi:MAG: serine--tRNA ligase [bacterium]